MGRNILVINPGSTTSKIGIYDMDAGEFLFVETVVHDEQKILEFEYVADQKEYRKEMIEKLCEERLPGYKETLVCCVGRGGMLRKLLGGGYRVNQKMCTEIASPDVQQHASSLGALIAFAIAEPLGIPSFIYDSPVGCDLMPEAKITGIPQCERYGAIHLLNTRACDIRYAEERRKDYREMNFINCHMGGGITVNAMAKGEVVDAYGYDEGPMAPERSGGVPLLLFRELCFSGEYTNEEVGRLISGKGGLYAHLGTKECRDVERRIEEGDEKAKLVYSAMALQAAKSIGALSASLSGKVDAIILTGGAANSKLLTGMIKERVSHLGEVYVIPGELEMEALAEGAVRMLAGEEEAKVL